MQNFGVTNKEHYGILRYFLEWSILLVTLKFCISLVFGFSWDHPLNPQEKLKTTLVQKFGVTRKEYYGML